MRAAGIALARRACQPAPHLAHGLALRSVTRVHEHAPFPGSAPPARPVLSSRLQSGFSAAHVNQKAVFPRALRATGTLGLTERGLTTEGPVAAVEEEKEETALGKSSAEVNAELQEVLQLVEEKKAHNVVVLSADDIPRMRILCDYMIVLTCTSRRHMKVVGTHLCEHYKLKGMLLDRQNDDDHRFKEPPSIEDEHSEEWMLVDLRNIIVQIMSDEGRARFTLEDHWRGLGEEDRRNEKDLMVERKEERQTEVEVDQAKAKAKKAAAELRMKQDMQIEEALAEQRAEAAAKEGV
ncbi:hypothetical protein T484DRAFT_1939565 [Baffinella frigidus]|nr:hypothetical protein T484DRAFT_1939565 [Cryptophyta sp. CCMP2293]